MGKLRTYRAVWLVLIGIALPVGCEQQAQTGSPQRYDTGGLRFDYPGNWRVTEDTKDAGVHAVTIETPGDAIVVAQRFDAGLDIDLDVFVDTLMDNAQQMMPVGNVGNLSKAPASRLVAGQQVNGIVCTFDIQLAGESVPHTQMTYKIDHPNGPAIITCQVADEDLSKVQAGFEQILDSLETP